MAKTIGGIPRQPVPVRAPGRVQVVWNEKFQKYIIKSWPRPRGKGTAAQQQVSADFKQAVQLMKLATPEDVASAYAFTAGTPLLPRDALMKAIYGQLIVARTTDGKLWMGLKMANTDIQTYLDSISSDIGVMLVRTADGWVALAPGADTDVLQIDSITHAPAWAPIATPSANGAPVGSIDPIGSASNGANFVNGRAVFLPKGTIVDTAHFWAWQATSVNWSMALYAADTTNTSRPRALLASTGTVANTVKGVNSAPLTASFEAPDDMAAFLLFITDAAVNVGTDLSTAQIYHSGGSLTWPADYNVTFNGGSARLALALTKAP